MTVRTSSAASALRALAGISAALLAGLAAAPGAAAGEDPFAVSAPHPVRRHRDAGAAAPPRAFPPVAIVSGYLPRNTNLPMYNEPPSRGPR